jgi:hypothetical protein
MSLWNIGGALLGGLFGGDDEEQTSTSRSEPWSYAQPWMRENIESGQRLQEHYQQNPFSTEQMRAYDNAFGQSDRFRALMPSLMTQMGGQRQFDRSNPTLRPNQFNFSAPEATPGAPGASPGASGGRFGTNPFAGSWRPPAPAPAAPGAPAPGVFDWASGSGGPPNGDRYGGHLARFPANYAPVLDQWGGSVGSDGGYGGFGGQTGGDGALGFGGVY